MSRNVESVISPQQKEPSKSSFKKKLLAVVGLGGGDFFLGQGIRAIAAAEGATLGFMRPMIEKHSSAVVLGSALAIGTIVTAIGAWKNKDLLKDEKIGASPNAIGTISFYAADKIWPSEDTARNFFARKFLPVAAMDVRLIAPTIVAFNLVDRKWPAKEPARDVITQLAQIFGTSDYFLIAPALANETTLVAFVTAKTATSAFTLVKAGISEVVLRKAKNKERAEKQEKKKIAPSGLVFDAKAIPAAVGD